MAYSCWAGGWHGRERCGFQGFQEADLRLRTDNSGNRLSPSGSSLAAANLRLAGLRYVSEFPGAEGFPRVLGKIARGSALRSHRRAFQTHKARRTAGRRWRVSAALNCSRSRRLVIDAYKLFASSLGIRPGRESYVRIAGVERHYEWIGPKRDVKSILSAWKGVAMRRVPLLEKPVVGD